MKYSHSIAILTTFTHELGKFQCSIIWFILNVYIEIERNIGKCKKYDSLSTYHWKFNEILKTACHIKYIYIYIFKIFTNFIWIFMLITTPWYFIFYLYDYIKVYITRLNVAHSEHCVFPEIYNRPSTAFLTLTHAVKQLSLFLVLTNKEIFIFFFINSPNIIRQLELRLLKIMVLWGGYILNFNQNQ